MKNQLPVVSMLVLIMSVLELTNSALINSTNDILSTSSPDTAEWTTGAAKWTTELPAHNLQGKMFTLSSTGGGRISLYRPYFSPSSSHPKYPWTTYPPWTTPAPHSGVSVCLRYITDYQETRSSSIFTLSPSSNPLQLRFSYGSKYWLSCDRYSLRNLYLHPNIFTESHVKSEIWTRVCLTVDTRNNMAQMFSGSYMSIRKFLPNPYVWSGESVIVLSGFHGQVTDVQVWDYPLSYAQVYDYMSNGFYTSYRGSVISWSNIMYSARGKVLLEDVFNLQGKQLFGSRGRGHRLKGEKKSRRFFSGGKNNEIEI